MRRSRGFIPFLAFIIIGLFSICLNGENLEVTVIPQGRLQGINQLTEMSFTFTQPMVTLGDIKKEYVPEFVTITPGLAGKFYWAGDRILKFFPSGPIPWATAYEIRVKKGVRSLSGSELAKDFSFRLETPAPALMRWRPYQNSLVSGDNNFLLGFNQPVSLAEIEAKLKLVALPRLFEIRSGYSTGSAEARNRLEKLRQNVLARKGEKRSLRFRVEYEKESRIDVLLYPLEPLPADSSLAIVVPKGLRGQEGNLGAAKNQEVPYRTISTFLYGGINCTDCEPYDSVVLAFSNSVRSKDVAAHTRLIDLDNNQPVPRRPDEELSGAWWWESATNDACEISYIYPMRAGRHYRVEIAPELSDIYGNKLGYAVREEFALRDFPASVQLINRWGVIESFGPKYLSLQVMNVDTVQREVRSIPDEEIGRYLAYLDSNETHLLQENSPELKLKTEMNLSTVVNVDLKKILPRESDIVYAEIWRGQTKPGTDWNDDQKFSNGILQITDIGLSFKYSPHNSLVYATSLSQGKPLGRCQVKMLSMDGKMLWQGETNEGGLCLGPGLEDLGVTNEWKNDLIVLVRKGNDRAFLTEEWNNGIETWTFNVDEDWRTSARRNMGYLFSDRGAYRPGEEVYIKAIFRLDARDRLVLPPAGEVEFVVFDPRDSEMLRQKVALDGFGSASFSFRIPEGTATGYCRINAIVPEQWKGEDTEFSHSVLIAEYRKPDFRVDLAMAKKDYVAGATAEGVIKGAYLYGAAMKECAAKWVLRRSATFYAPPLLGELASKDFVFSDWTVLESDSSRSGVEVLGEGDGRLNDAGELTFRQPLGFFATPQNCQVEAEVTDVTAQAIAGRASFLLHPSSVYIGLERGDYFVSKGKPFRTSLLALGVDGTPLAGKKITVQLIRREWHSVQEKQEGAYYRYRSEAVDTVLKTKELVSTQKPCPLEFMVENGGYFMVRAVHVDERKNEIRAGLGFYGIGGDFAAWERYDHNRMDLVPEKQKYNPGEKARILVKSPWTEAEGIVTVERTGIIDYFPVRLKGSTQVVEIPVKKEYIPTAFISVLLIKGRSAEKLEGGVDVGKPTFRLGYCKLEIVPDEVYLKVNIACDKEEYRPRDKVNIRLQVNEAAGQGVRSQVTLYAVDYGVLSLTNYQLPDPVAYFYSQRGLAVKNAESFLVLISRDYLQGKLAEEAGGGGMGGELFALRQDFRVTPFWQAEVLTDAQGLATAAFDLPDSLTTFVVMAVAQTEHANFGSARREIRVSKPLMLFPTLPRFLLVGDSAEGAVRVQNNTKLSGELTIKAQARSGLIVTDSRDMKMPLAAGASVVVRFPLRANGAGREKLRFLALAKFGETEERDAIEIVLPVNTPKVKIDAATFGSTENSDVFRVAIPQNIFLNQGGLRLTLASSALADLQGSSEFLLDYPYGCTEQLASQLIPFVALKNFAGAFRFRNFNEKDIGRVISETLTKIYRNQQPDGGFGLWVDSTRSFPYLSAYVLFVFKMAEYRGINVDHEVKDNLDRYLRQALKDKGDAGFGSVLTAKAFMLYTLGLDKIYEPSYETLLYEKRSSLPLFAKAFLLTTVRHSRKDKTMRDTLLSEIINSVKQEAATAHFEEAAFAGQQVIMHSGLRSNAMILLALLEADYPGPLLEKVVAYLLVQRKNGTWRNTQENSYALLSLSEYFRRREGGSIDFRVKAAVGSRNLAELSFREIRKDIVNLAMEELRKLAVERQLTVNLEKSGQGRLFWGATLTFFPRGNDFQEINQGFAVRRVYEKLDTGEVKNKFALGDLIRVRVTIKVSGEKTYAAVVDPIPAGCEILNEYLQTSRTDTQQPGDSSWYFAHKEPYDDRMQCFADHLPTGEHQLTYVLRATSKGTFSIPALKAEEMYNPEVFGTTVGATFTIE